MINGSSDRVDDGFTAEGFCDRHHIHLGRSHINAGRQQAAVAILASDPRQFLLHTCGHQRGMLINRPSNWQFAIRVLMEDALPSMDASTPPPAAIDFVAFACHNMDRNGLQIGSVSEPTIDTIIMSQRGKWVQRCRTI